MDGPLNYITLDIVHCDGHNCFTAFLIGLHAFRSEFDMNTSFVKLSIVGFLRVLWFPPTGNVDRVGWGYPPN